MINENIDFETSSLYISEFIDNLQNPLNLTNILNDLFDSDITKRLDSSKEKILNQDPLIQKIFLDCFNANNILNKSKTTDSKSNFYNSVSFNDIEECANRNEVINYDFHKTINKNINDYHRNNSLSTNPHKNSSDSDDSIKRESIINKYSSKSKSIFAPAEKSDLSNKQENNENSNLKAMKNKLQLAPIQTLNKKKEILFHDPFLSRPDDSSLFKKNDKIFSAQIINKNNEKFNDENSQSEEDEEKKKNSNNDNIEIIKRIKIIQASGYNDEKQNMSSNNLFLPLPKNALENIKKASIQIRPSKVLSNEINGKKLKKIKFNFNYIIRQF